VFGTGAAIARPGNLCPGSIGIIGDVSIGEAGATLLRLIFKGPPLFFLFFAFISGVAEFSGSRSFCSAKRHMKASFPELCIVHWTSTLVEERRLLRERVDPDARGWPVLGSCIVPRSPIENSALSYDAVSMSSTLWGSSAEVMINEE
jgi:hypothetical protein